MELGIFYIIFSVLVGWYASARKGKSGIGYFLFALLLSPLIAGIVALIVKPDIKAIEEKVLDSGDSKKCPFCAEIIKAEAKVCRYCGKEQSLESTLMVQCQKCHRVFPYRDARFVDGKLLCKTCL